MRNYSQCACGGIQKDLCLCTWIKYGKPAAENTVMDQRDLFENLLKKLTPKISKRHPREKFTTFAKQFMDIAFKNRPKEIDIDVWEDIALSNNISKFRQNHWKTFGLMGFEIITRTNSQSIRFQENPEMYCKTDQKYLKKIGKKPHLMKNEDRDLARWLTEEPLNATYPYDCKRIHTNLCVDRKLKVMRVAK